MNICKNLCLNIGKKHGGKLEYPYINGYKFCCKCNLYFNFSNDNCFCCGCKYRIIQANEKVKK